ncbi:MAG: L-threonylcarbamoyladenylate synthase [Clostridia bacterium]|nr:L-threonylcarbamoyladenylate synthase [Clostridia bacterium]MDD4048262.1 L-threonylcarbamoyladenylate synthase [Clostridia bacterium]
METKYWKVFKDDINHKIIERAAGIISDGGLVAFPTETVYGLGANGLNSQAVKRIFEAKGRPIDNPLILHVAEAEDVFKLASQVTECAQKAINTFWPGPLTIILPKQKDIPIEVTAGLDTVAIRMPAHPVALALIKEAGVPVAAPSANRSGYPSPTTGQHVYDDLGGRIEAILDSGFTGVGLESTILDLSGDIPTILRPGGITREALSEVLGTVRVDPGLTDLQQKPKAPGMKYTHYSPRAEVVLIKGERENVRCKICELVENYFCMGKKIGLLLTEETWENIDDKVMLSATYSKNLGSCLALDEIARMLYGELRSCDVAGVDIIFTETYTEKGLGAALMNRLLKSAGYKVVNV